MYVLDQVIYGKLQLTDYRDPSSKVGVLDGEKLKCKKSNLKALKIAENVVAPPGEWKSN